MARTMPNAPSVPMAPHPFRDFTDLLEDVVMSRRHRAERRPGEFMADRSGNGRRRRSGLRLAWLVLLTLVARAGILLRGDHLARMHLLARAGLFAHELAHVSQRKLADGGKAGAAMWILEGHADWVKFQVLELLGLRQYRESRDEVVRSSSPDLQVLTTSAGWVRSMNQLGDPATYGQAFLAVDWLIERYGSAKLLEFLGRFALQAEPREHWRTVFSIADRQFGDEFRSRLEGLR